ncbi:hypothetical protein HYS72_03385 [Candidatus Pacearchaeota archaeon]|nr:hypothetical protein [Candidatus Pacearchaeota archaeon]MBI2056940.1 hypothetical protein [Candidatus Pacearchaeota archaeon]
MNFIRGSLLVFISVLLLISLLVLGIFATLNYSLKYEIIKPQIKSFVKEFVVNEVNKTIIDEQVEILQTHCKTTQDYAFNDETTNYTFVIPCEVISEGTDEIINVESEILIDRYYLKKYECGFLECFKSETPLFIISQHAKDFWKKQFYTFLIVSLLLAVLIFLLVEKKNNFPILIGALLIAGFLPLLALSGIAKFAVSSLASGIPFDLSSIALVFFNKANSVFLTGFIIGAILIGIGIFWELIIIGLKIEHWFERKDDEK